ncbi:hypothetical protein [Parvibaculum sp.]|uniref:hypothetical protein n=1 Tax=Parvibaculum sp. TaxID=2024848 RepID=UPI0027374ADD|nr:hypothetical protein [Parvibaculum sp.]MDP3327227.1 hypothetical protein [Parvibaculum sp.]
MIAVLVTLTRNFPFTSLRGGVADEAIQPYDAAPGLLRFARNDENKKETPMTALFTAGQPLECPLRKVEKQWVDFNGHLNMAYDCNRPAVNSENVNYNNVLYDFQKTENARCQR